MFEFIKKIFSNHKDTDKDEIQLEYKSASSLGKTDNLPEIPQLEIPQNTFKNILILDDNEEAGEISYMDIKFIFGIAKKLRESGVDNLSKKQHDFISKLPNNLFHSLNSLCINDFNIIIATGEMAAFSIFNAIDSGLKVDYAILDILIGGFNEYSGKGQILDGIDVSKKILESNPNCKYIFYSGCSLVENSDETIKYKNIYGSKCDFQSKVVLKDKDLYNKRMKILDLIIG